MRAAGLLVRAVVVALVLTLFPPVGQVVVHASPETLTETLTNLPEAAADEAFADSDFSTAGVTAPDVSRSEIVDAPITFNMLGVRAPEAATFLRVRTHDGETWSGWTPLEFVEDEDGPDAATSEEAAAERTPGRPTEPLWVGEADRLQIEVEGAAVGELITTLIDSMGSSGGPVRRSYETTTGPGPAEAATDLDVISRAEWGADESLRDGSPSYADEVHMGVVHHTAHTPDTDRANSYSQAEAPGLIRAMYEYHTKSLGWSDIGYNVLVDRFGNVYEGRAGGFERSVIGAHARGFNTGSFGVSIIGNFLDRQASSAAIEAVTEVIGVKSAIHGIDPTGWTNEMGDEWRPTIIGHRDVGSTSCPGRVHDLLPQIRDQAQGMSMRFPDVPTSSVHREAILSLADAGVTHGCRINAFCPDRGLNRAQASTFVVQAFDLDPVPGSRFPDVGEDGVHASSINALAEREWIRGYTDGRFGPWDELSRGQLATVLARAMELPLDQPASDPYPDVPRTHTHAPAIAALKEKDVVGDCGSGRFCPDDIALRDSTASFVNMTIEAQKAPEIQDVVTRDDG